MRRPRRHSIGMRYLSALACAASLLASAPGRAADAVGDVDLRPVLSAPVPELGYRVSTTLLRDPSHLGRGEASGVAVNSRGHVYLFQRVEPMLVEYDARGRYLRALAPGLFKHPHGLRVDRDENLWVTDDFDHLVLKLNPAGEVLLVLGRRGAGAEADWLFNAPTDVAFGRDGSVYVADGYGNSRIVKFDRNGRFLLAWGSFGKAPGQFNLPHSVVVDDRDQVYVADRENGRIQIFDADGRFLRQWTGVGYPYGLAITPDQHVWMIDGGYDRVVEFDRDGRVLGAIGSPGHAPGEFAWGHFLGIGADRRLYVADVLNWRFQVFEPVPASGRNAEYVPSTRMYWEQTPSTGWATRPRGER